LAAGWGRALDEARRGEAKGKRRPEEERRLASRELGRGVHELLEVLLAQRIGELLNLTRGRIDVIGDWHFVLLAQLTTGIVESRGDGIERAGKTLLLQAELRGRLLASRIDELHGLILRLANHLRSLATQIGATAAGPFGSALGAIPRASRRARPGCSRPRLLAACRFP